MTEVRRRSLAWLCSAVVATALSGCLGDSGISIDVDEKEARFVRSNVLKTLDRSLTVALEAVEGHPVEQRRRVTSSPCSEYDDGISVEVRARFIVESDDLSEVVRKIARVWRAEGWKVDAEVKGYPTPHVLFDTGPRSIKRAVGTATTLRRDPEQGREHTMVRLEVGSTCIDPPEDELPLSWPFGPA